MGFIQLLKSFDELLYEVMSWLVFYPITLWRTLRHPWRMMRYARTELGDAVEDQYVDTLSPPLFLFISLVLSHAVELAIVGQSSIVKNTQGLAGLIDSDTNLILLRVMVFALFPLLFATRLVRRQKAPLTRETLRAPFYGQCYAAGPFALAIGVGVNMFYVTPAWSHFAGWLIIVGTLLWYGMLQTRWYALHLKQSKLRAFGDASLAMVECLAASLVVAFLFS